MNSLISLVCSIGSGQSGDSDCFYHWLFYHWLSMIDNHLLTLHDGQRIFHFGAQDIRAKDSGQVLHTHFVNSGIGLYFIQESVGYMNVNQTQWGQICQWNKMSY